MNVIKELAGYYHRLHKSSDILEMQFCAKAIEQCVQMLWPEQSAAFHGDCLFVVDERKLITQNLFDKPYHGVHALAKNKLTVICRGINEKCDDYCYHRTPHECNTSCKIGQDVCSKGQACCLPIGIILVTQECYHYKRRWRRCDNCVDCGHCKPKDT